MANTRAYPVPSRDEDFEYEDQSENEFDLKLSGTDFSTLIVAPSDWTIESLSRQIGKQIDLDPAVQRRGVWNTKAKSAFVESLFLNIPIPQILLAAKKADRNAFIVLDGKQRLLTIREFLDGKHDSGKPFKLRDMRILSELEGKTWEEVKPDQRLSDTFLNQTIRTAILRGWENEDVLFEIFQRLNSGSVKLSPMELRMSLHPGDFLKWVIRWTEQVRKLHGLLRLKGPDKRMADVELAVRFLAFKRRSAGYRGDLKAFLDTVSQEFNTQFSSSEFRSVIELDLQEMEDAIAADVDIFGGHSCRKWKGGEYDTRFNRAVFDVQIGSLSDSRVRNWINSAAVNKKKFEEAFIDLSSADPDFVTSVETTTKSLAAVRKRFTAWYKAVGDVTGIALQPPAIGDEAPN